MATFNPYTRSYKSKKEEYEEKLKQRNENQEWIFGNTFGRPGAGAPLRDNQGNIISNLKSITNGNIYKYDAQDFTKGDRNISVVNNKIFERNDNNQGVNQIISDPFTPFRNYINQFEQNKTNNVQNINQYNQLQNNPQNILLNNNLNLMNINNNNQEIQKEIYLNQYRQNPYMINMNNQIMPYPFVQFPVMYPFISLTNQNSVQGNNNLNNTNKNISNNNINNNERPSTTTNFSNNYKINNDTNSQNNENNYNTISNRPISNTNRFNSRKMPDTTFNIFKNDIDPEKIKLEKERQKEEWRRELVKQINEKKKREEEEKQKMKDQEKKEELNNEEYFKTKKKQQEEQARKHKEKINRLMQNDVEASMGNILDLTNDLDQANKSIRSISRQEIQNNNINNNINNNVIIPQPQQQNISIINNQYIPEDENNLQESHNFKNFINNQSNNLNNIINNDIDNEIKRLSDEITNNYSPFTQQILLMNDGGKTIKETVFENNQRLKKAQDLLEERKLVDYILGQRERPPTPPENENKLMDIPLPSFFGINRDKNTNKDLSLPSKSSFISNNADITNFIAAKRNLNLKGVKIENDIIKNKEISDNVKEVLLQDLNEVANTNKTTFGTNVQNEKTFGGNLNYAKNLDNTSTFIPLDDNKVNVNYMNDKKIKYTAGNNQYEPPKDTQMEELFKDLNDIYDLTNQIDVTTKSKSIYDYYVRDMNNVKQKNEEVNSNLNINSNKIVSNISIDNKDKSANDSSNNNNINQNNEKNNANSGNEESQNNNKEENNKEENNNKENNNSNSGNSNVNPMNESNNKGSSSDATNKNKNESEKQASSKVGEEEEYEDEEEEGEEEEESKDK